MMDTEERLRLRRESRYKAVPPPPQASKMSECAFGKPFEHAHR